MQTSTRTKFFGFREVDEDEAFTLWNLCGVVPYLTDDFHREPSEFGSSWLNANGGIRNYWIRNHKNGERYWVKEDDDAQSNG